MPKILALREKKHAFEDKLQKIINVGVEFTN